MTITTRIKEKLDNYRTCVLMAIDFLSKDQLEEAGVRFRKSAGAYMKIILYEQMGDETGWLMMYENDPCRIYIPTKVLLANHVNELIDSAHTGAMTYHSDFELMSESLIETVGTDLIPAGRYPTYLTTYKGDSVVCICLDTIL